MIVTCPHCNEFVMIEELNCCIFRHAIYKTTFQQVNPHASKEECERLVQEESVYGCCKPFKIVNNEAVECDYI